MSNPMDEETERCMWAFRHAGPSRLTETTLNALRQRIRELVDQARKEGAARVGMNAVRVELPPIDWEY